MGYDWVSQKASRTENCIKQKMGKRGGGMTKDKVLILLNYPKTSSDVIELGRLNEGLRV